MKNRTLGLDIGTNSIGWALIESSVDGPAGTVLGLGARVFPEGVNRDQQGAEHSKNEDRRIARGMRRQIARRARRKAVLRRSLIEAGLLPSEPDAQRKIDALDPYMLRSDGLLRRLEPFEIGRVLVHLNQRRGFLSNRKADRGRAKENSETLQEINSLAGEMGQRTLGQHFAEKRSVDQHQKIRGQHTRREMYLDEFDRIWTEQAKHHPALLTDELRYGRRRNGQRYPREPIPLKRRESDSLLSEFGLYGIMFFQRSLYWPKSVIGRCELTGERRCHRADRLAQRFRLLNEVNNLRIVPEYGQPRPLTESQWSKVIAALSKTKEQTFDQLRKVIGLLESDRFNLERAERKKLLGLPVDVVLAKKDLFHKSWDGFDEPTKDAIVRSLLNDEEPEIRGKAMNEWGCSPELADRLIDFDPTSVTDGYASFSRSAMERLLPHLERRLRLMGNDVSDSALHAAGFLRPDEKVIKQTDRLPEVPAEIVNPIVRQALYEVRKVVHAIIREFGIPDHIHVELAREAKGNAEQRARQIREMRENERRRNEAAEWIREFGGAKLTRDSIQRYLLWKEQGEECIYSGRTISPAQLFGGEVDFDHILPYSKCLDDSMANKVVAFRSENTRKGQQTPWQWLGEADPEKYAHVLQRARRLLFGKRQRFSQHDVELNDFLARQLSDTAYITTCVRQYISRLGVDVVCTKGQSTAELRQLWGLNKVLRDDDLNLKSRDDHRHHAVDALIIALTNRSALQKLARTRGDKADVLPLPWENFREQVGEIVDGIRVSHRVGRRIAGALHEETIYGPTDKPKFATDQPRPHAQDWIEDSATFVIRKPLSSLTPAMIDEIRDPHVKNLIVNRLRKHGIDHTARGAKIGKDVWNEPLFLVPKSGKQTDKAHVIKYVRVLRRDQTIKPIRGGTACVKPGNTHHILLFDLPGSTPDKPKRDMIAVSMLDAVKRQRSGKPIIQRQHPAVPDAKFLFSLSSGEMVLAKFKGQPEDLFVFRTAAGTSKQMWFVHHCDARLSADAKVFSAKPNTLDAVKVTIDPLGRIRNAND